MKGLRHLLVAFAPALMAWGAVARTVDVRDFGATGTGNADDAQSIQRALCGERLRASAHGAVPQQEEPAVLPT